MLGIDPGLANMGYAVLEIGAKSDRVVRMGVICTEKSDKKVNVLASDDNLRRAREMYSYLWKNVVGAWQISAMCVEAKSFPRNASAAAKTAISWGLIAALSEHLNIPVCQVSPQAQKKCVAGSKSASKEEVQGALDGIYGQNNLRSIGLEGLPKGKLEHPYDALATIHACMSSDMIRMLRRAQETG